MLIHEDNGNLHIEPVEPPTIIITPHEIVEWHFNLTLSDSFHRLTLTLPFASLKALSKALEPF